VKLHHFVTVLYLITLQGSVYTHMRWSGYLFCIPPC